MSVVSTVSHRVRSHAVRLPRWLIVVIIVVAFLGYTYCVRWWALDNVGAYVVLRGASGECLLADTDDAHTVATYAPEYGKCGGRALAHWRIAHWW